MAIPNYASHADVPSEYVWRLTDIYATPQDWEAALARAQAMTEELAGYAGRLAESADTLRAALQLLEKAQKELEQAYCYTFLQFDLDNGNAEYQAMRDRAMALLNDFDEKSSFIMPELTAMDPDTLHDRIWNDPALADFRHMADDLIRSRAHVLSAREEQLLSMASPALQSIETAFKMLDRVDLDRPEI